MIRRALLNMEDGMRNREHWRFGAHEFVCRAGVLLPALLDCVLGQPQGEQ